VVLLAACGVPADGSPQRVADDDLPSVLRPEGGTTTTSAAEPHEVVLVYLVDGEDLVAAPASVPAPANLRAVLRALERGPTGEQANSGMRTALPGDIIRDATVSGSTAAIDLDSAFTDAPRADQALGLGQLVLTATARPGITSVRLTVDGKPTQVPRADGSLTAAPLTRSAYSRLLAR
jgi:spore germination protein GerM